MARANLTTNTINVQELNNSTDNTSSSVSTDKTLNEYGLYDYVDEFGNLIQIKRGAKKRLEFYPERINAPVIEPCVIGVSDPTSENCTEGIAMGCGDIGSSTEMAYAIY